MQLHRIKLLCLVAAAGCGGGSSSNPAASNSPPVLGSLGTHTVTPGHSISFSVTATNPDGDGLTFSTAGTSSSVTISTTAQDPDTPTNMLSYSGSVVGCTGAIDASTATITCPEIASYATSISVSDPDGNSSAPFNFSFGVCSNGTLTP